MSATAAPGGPDPAQPVSDLPYQLHNFVIVLSTAFFFVWLWRLIFRARSLLELWLAFKGRNVIRIDGFNAMVRAQGAISRAHLQQLLTQRSRYTPQRVERLAVPFHLDVKSLRIGNPSMRRASESGGILSPSLAPEKPAGNPAAAAALAAVPLLLADGAAAGAAPLTRSSSSEQPEPVAAASSSSNAAPPAPQPMPDALTLRVRVNNRVPVVVDLYYGLSGSAIRELFRQRYGDGDGAKARDGRGKRGNRKGRESVELRDLSGDVFARDKYLKHQSLLVEAVSEASLASFDIDVPLLSEVLAERDPGKRALVLFMREDRSEGRERKDVEPPMRGEAEEKGDGEARRPLLAQMAILNVERKDREFSARVETLMLVTDTQILEQLDVYCIDDPSSLECTVCLTEPREIIPLPCRHCCICRNCFENLNGKCPFCRAEILNFMQFGAAQEPRAFVDKKRR
jgi:hypothetical protein